MNIAKESQENGILKFLCKRDSNLLMFHHRFPTSTINVAKAAHPHSSGNFFGDRQYILVHNGVIRNASELFVKHQQLGIEYKSLLTDLTFNDSEALLWDFALTMEGKQKDMEAYGDIAFICMMTEKGALKKMYFGRNNRPLNMYRDKNTIELSSEGRGTAIKPHTLHDWDYKRSMLSTTPMNFPQFGRYNGAPSYQSGYVEHPVVKGLPAGGYQPKEYIPKKEYGSYDEYATDKAEKNWERLRKKFDTSLKGRKTDSNTSTCHQYPSGVITSSKVPKTVGEAADYVLEARKTKSGLYVAEVNGKIDVDDAMVNKWDFQPTEDEIVRCAMSYIDEAQGNFEAAYSLLEFNYAEFMDEVIGVETIDDVRTQLLMESALEYLNSDPEYKNESSISSVWASLNAQQEAARVKQIGFAV